MTPLAAVLAASVTLSDAPQRLEGALVLPRKAPDACARVLPPMEDTVARIVRALCWRERLHPDRRQELRGR